MITFWDAARHGGRRRSAPVPPFAGQALRRSRLAAPATTDPCPQTFGLRFGPFWLFSFLETDPDIDAVYSIGGGNMAIVEAFASTGRTYSVFIAHDLDQDNTRLLRGGPISAVLHHDLNQDMRRACHTIMQAHKALPGAAHLWPSNIHVITPYNMPAPALYER